MKTKKLPLLLAIAAFGLTSCFDIAGLTGSAQSTGDTDSSEIIDSIISSDSETGDSSSSGDPSATSSEEPASSSSEGPTSSSSEGPTASTSDEPGPSSSEEPASSTSEEPATSTSEEPEPEPEPEPDEEEKNAISITNSLGDYPFTVGDTIDLDEYITVNYSDGSSDKAYSITTSSSVVTIENHVVTFTAAGSCILRCASNDGNVSTRISLTAKTAETMEVIDFLYPILDNDENFTYKLYDSSDGYITHYGTFAYTENYTAMYDPDDYGILGLYSTFGGQILATLSDGNYYWGNFVDGGADVEFDPGIESNGAYYYIRMANVLDPLDFDVYTDETNGNYILGGTSVSEALFYNLSLGTSSYYTFGPAQILGWIDNDGDGVNDELVLIPTFYDAYNDGYTYYTDVIVGITDIGTTGIDVLDNAIDNPDYLPRGIEYDDLGTALDALAAADNYTVDIGVYGYDYANDEFYSEIPEDHFLNDWLGITKSVEQTNYVTADGIYSEVTVYGDEEPSYEFAYFNNDSRCYYYTNGNHPWNGGTSNHIVSRLYGVTDVFEYDWVTPSLASNIDSASLSGLNFTGYEENGGYQTWTADLGDYDGTTQTNGLFVSLFDQFSVFATNDGKLGTYLGGQTWFSTSSGYASFTISGAYDYIDVYEDGSISISCYIYEPTSNHTAANSYAFLTYTFQAASQGATEVDFDSLLAE